MAWHVASNGGMAVVGTVTWPGIIHQQVLAVCLLWASLGCVCIEIMVSVEGRIQGDLGE